MKNRDITLILSLFIEGSSFTKTVKTNHLMKIPKGVLTFDVQSGEKIRNSLKREVKAIYVTFSEMITFCIIRCLKVETLACDSKANVTQ